MDNSFFPSLRAISLSGYTTSAPSLLSTAPCSRLSAFAITRGTPISITLMVVNTLTSTFSPIQIITTSQFCIPISFNVSELRLSATNAQSVYCRISFTFFSSLSTAMTSCPDCASIIASASPKRPSPMTPYAVSTFFFIFLNSPFLLSY